MHTWFIGKSIINESIFTEMESEGMEGIRIITDRLVLQPLGMKYLQSTHAYASDIENAMLMVYLPNKTIDETIEFLTYVDNEWQKMNPIAYEFAILLDGVHIGAVSINLEDDRKTGELGWIIDKKYWKQGYATEAAKAVIEFAMDKLGVTHFIAHCDSENTGSYKIMEKLGMKLTDRSSGRKNKSSDEDREELKYERIIGE